MYRVEFTAIARNEVARLEKSESQAFKKIEKLLKELVEHPYTGTGKPKPLGGDRTGQWSRRITDKHRLVYTIEDEKLIVLVLSASSHYGDK